MKRIIVIFTAALAMHAEAALACRMPVEFSVIASGTNLTGDVDLTQRRVEAIFVPSLSSSGALAVQGNHDSTSAGFYRLASASSEIRFPVGAGSLGLLWPTTLPQPAYARFEVLTAAGSFQTSPRTLTLVTRPR